MALIIDRLINSSFTIEDLDCLLSEDTYDTLKKVSKDNLKNNDEYLNNPPGKLRLDKVIDGGRTLVFLVPSQSEPGRFYSDKVEFVDYDKYAKDFTKSRFERANLIMQGDIKLFCNCPAFKYWGYQYIDTRRKASIEPENRFPSKRNPKLKGATCKHLNLILKVLPFYNSTLAGYLPKAAAPETKPVKPIPPVSTSKPKEKPKNPENKLNKEPPKVDTKPKSNSTLEPTPKLPDTKTQVVKVVGNVHNS